MFWLTFAWQEAARQPPREDGRGTHARCSQAGNERLTGGCNVVAPDKSRRGRPGWARRPPATARQTGPPAAPPSAPRAARRLRRTEKNPYQNRCLRLYRRHTVRSQLVGAVLSASVVRKEALDIWHAVYSTAHSEVSLPTRLSPRPDTPCCSSDLTLIEPWTDQHRDATAHRRLGRACASCVTCAAGIQRCVHGLQAELVEVSVHALHVAGDERHQVPACRYGSWAT